MTDFSTIKNMIFDLGGVIINLDLDKTYKSFSNISGISVDDIKSKLHFTQFWKDHEVGLISDEDFRQNIKNLLQIDISDNKIDDIWNELLLDIPIERIKLLQKLSEKYNLFLLSNTNGIHYIKFTEILHQTSGIKGFHELFIKDYYSHNIQMRKPNDDIYLHVLKENNLLPYQTVFIDDNYDNIKAATNLGIHTIHVIPPHTIIDLLENA
ncbi:MAG: HAD family phosphatase [Bacteroidota bacterium]|nr:HAD family phosphatase [Bacteroidota bacterium]